MIATLAEPVPATRDEPCRFFPRTDAHLIEMLARATRELRVREAAGQPTDGVRAVIRSVRTTLSRMAERGSVLSPDSSDFWVKHSSQGEMELWHRGKRMPVSTRHLESAFETAGLALQPGQRILADRELVRRCVSESLLDYALQEFRLREMKGELLRVTDELNVASIPACRVG